MTHQRSPVRTDGWSLIVQALTRPYPVTLPMVVLVLLVPCYIFIAQDVAGGPVHVPALPLDLVIPLVPGWALVYGPLYLFLILFPVLVIRQQEHIRRTVYAYLLVWLTAYVGFYLYPTVAPRPAEIEGEGFAFWGLRFLYGAESLVQLLPVTPRRAFLRLGVDVLSAAAKAGNRDGGLRHAGGGLHTVHEAALCG